MSGALDLATLASAVTEFPLDAPAVGEQLQAGVGGSAKPGGKGGSQRRRKVSTASGSKVVESPQKEPPVRGQPKRGKATASAESVNLPDGPPSKSVSKSVSKPMLTLFTMVAGGGGTLAEREAVRAAIGDKAATPTSTPSNPANNLVGMERLRMAATPPSSSVSEPAVSEPARSELSKLQEQLAASEKRVVELEHSLSVSTAGDGLTQPSHALPCAATHCRTHCHTLPHTAMCCHTLPCVATELALSRGNEAARKEELSVMQGQVYNALTTAGKFEGELLGTKHELRSSETLVQWLQKIVAGKIPPE